MSTESQTTMAELQNRDADEPLDCGFPWPESGGCRQFEPSLKELLDLSALCERFFERENLFLICRARDMPFFRSAKQEANNLSLAIAPFVIYVLFLLVYSEGDLCFLVFVIHVKLLVCKQCVLIGREIKCIAKDGESIKIKAFTD